MIKDRVRHLWPKLLFFFSVIGPGIIAANADNDAGGISTYSIVGAHYGTKMLWVLFLITISLGITQEMGMRIGLVTRQAGPGLECPRPHSPAPRHHAAARHPTGRSPRTEVISPR